MDVGGSGSQEERRCTDRMEPDRDTHIRLLGRASVYVRSARDKLSDERQAVQIAGSLGCRVVIAASGPAQPGNLVQRGKSLRSRIRIGAFIQQECCKLVMNIADSQHEGVDSCLGLP